MPRPRAEVTPRVLVGDQLAEDGLARLREHAQVEVRLKQKEPDSGTVARDEWNSCSLLKEFEGCFDAGNGSANLLADSQEDFRTKHDVKISLCTSQPGFLI